MKFEKPRGTRDFNTCEMSDRLFVRDKISQVFASFGYQPILTPTFEKAELFTEKSGQEITDHMYVFVDKGGRSLCLRPEATASVARMYSGIIRGLPKPIKVSYYCPMFRYEEPQKGRYREFFQMGVELIGLSNPQSDAEVISLASECLKSLGLRCRIRISDIRLIRSMLSGLGISQDEQDKVIHLLDKGDVDGIRDIVTDDGFFEIIGLSGGIEVVEKACKSLKGDILNTMDGFIKTLQLLDIASIEYMVDFSMARGLDYYTGMVFDIKVEGMGAQDQVCGGGRYDSLISLFGGPDTPSVGFAFGFDRICEAMDLQDIKIPKPGVDAYVMAVDEKVGGQAFKIANDLRRLLPDKVILYGLLGRKLNKELEQASKLNARYALIVGERELMSDSVILKELSSGEQCIVKLKDLKSRF